MLPANVRLDWKVIAWYKHSSLFGLIISNEGKMFYNIDTRCQCYKTFFSLIRVTNSSFLMILTGSLLVVELLNYGHALDKAIVILDEFSN